MLRTQLTSRTSLVALFALSLAGLTGCSKDDGKSGDKGERVSNGAIAGQTGEDLGLLPVDSELVMGIDFKSLQASALWKTFVQPKVMENMAKLDEFKAKCGFDPIETVTSMSISARNLGGSGKPDLAAVVHGADKTKVIGCFNKLKDEAAASGDEVTTSGDTVLVKTKSNVSVAVLFVNDTTMLILGPNGTLDGAKAMAAGGSALKSSPKFVEMYSKLNPTDTMWLLMNGESKLFKTLPIAKPKAVFGSLNITDSITADVRIRLDTPDNATSLAAMLKGQAQQAAGFADKLEVVGDGPDVHVSVAMSLDKLKMVSSLLGGLGGGMKHHPPTPTPADP